MCAFMFLLLAPHTKNARVRIFVLFVIGSTKKRMCTDFFLFLWHHTKNARVRFFVFLLAPHTKKRVRFFSSFHTTPPRCECRFEVLDTTREVLSVKR